VQVSPYESETESSFAQPSEVSIGASSTSSSTASSSTVSSSTGASSTSSADYPSQAQH